jgi:hypothetical protein
MWPAGEALSPVPVWFMFTRTRSNESRGGPETIALHWWEENTSLATWLRRLCLLEPLWLLGACQLVLVQVYCSVGRVFLFSRIISISTMLDRSGTKDGITRCSLMYCTHLTPKFSLVDAYPYCQLTAARHMSRTPVTFLDIAVD